MKSGRLEAFSYCPTCANIRAVRQGIVTYSREATRIKGTCTSCGSSVDLVGRRHPGVKIGADKRNLN
jgi:hypothetical protein